MSDRFKVRDGEVKDTWSRLSFLALDEYDKRLKDYLYQTGFLPFFDVVDGKGITIPYTEVPIKKGKEDGKSIKRKILPLLLAVKKLHEDGKVIGDFTPDYVIETEEGIYLKNLGSGSLNFKKNDYSPTELYGYKPRAKKTSDVYAVSCYIYELITGIHLPPATDREQDEEYEPLYSYGVEGTFQKAVDKGLAVHAPDRYESMEQMVSDIYEDADVTDYERDFALKLKPYKQAEQTHEEEILQKEKRKKEEEEEMVVEDNDDPEDYEEEYRFYEKKIFWVIAVIVLLVLGVGGYVVYQTFFVEPPPPIAQIKQEALEIGGEVNYDNTFFEDMATVPEPTIEPTPEPVSESAVEITPAPTETPEPTPKPTKKPKKPKKTQKPKPTKAPTPRPRTIYVPTYTRRPAPTPRPTRPPDYVVN